MVKNQKVYLVHSGEDDHELVGIYSNIESAMSVLFAKNKIDGGYPYGTACVQNSERYVSRQYDYPYCGYLVSEFDLEDLYSEGDEL